MQTASNKQKIKVLSLDRIALSCGRCVPRHFLKLGLPMKQQKIFHALSNNTKFEGLYERVMLCFFGYILLWFSDAKMIGTLQTTTKKCYLEILACS